MENCSKAAHRHSRSILTFMSDRFEGLLLAVGCWLLVIGYLAVGYLAVGYWFSGRGLRQFSRKQLRAANSLSTSPILQKDRKKQKWPSCRLRRVPDVVMEIGLVISEGGSGFRSLRSKGGKGLFHKRENGQRMAAAAMAGRGAVIILRSIGMISLAAVFCLFRRRNFLNRGSMLAGAAGQAALAGGKRQVQHQQG